VTLRRFLRLYRVFAHNNIVRELEFRGNFFAKIFTNLGWLFSSWIFLEIVFQNTEAVAGWSKGQTFLLLGTFLLVRSLLDVFFTQNLGKIPEYIRLGTMDFVLTKPVSSQFFVSARFLSLDELGSTAGALLVLGYGLSLLKMVPTVAQVAAWTFLCVCGVLVLYSVQFLLMTLAFWLVRLDNLSALTDTVIFIGRNPPTIFPKYLALIFTFVIPVAFIAYVPALALKEGVSLYWLLAALGVTAFFLGASRFFWNYATRSYTSASS
jgi:ABC-2 type transport system permease protein